jgi:hypothetical protein
MWYSSTADAVLLYHISLSRSWLAPPERMQQLLWPAARAARGQFWALAAMWEPSAYYRAGEDGAVISQFDYSVGSGRASLAGFRMSYLPDWERMLRPFSLADKLSRPAALRRGSNVTLVQSNCASRSGREEFLARLLAALPVDSFGACLNNRDAGPFSLAAVGNDLGAAMRAKHDLVYGYKFLLVMENSIVHGGCSTVGVAGTVPLHIGPRAAALPPVTRRPLPLSLPPPPQTT